MQKVKIQNGATIFKKRSGRYAVQSGDGKWINGIEKVRILVDSGLVKAAVPLKEAPAPVAEAPAEAEPASS